MGRKGRVRWCLRAAFLTGLLGLAACAAWEIREPLSVTIADISPIEVSLLEQRLNAAGGLSIPFDTTGEWVVPSGNTRSGN